jgi:hypothetical protein
MIDLVGVAAAARLGRLDNGSNSSLLDFEVNGRFQSVQDLPVAIARFATPKWLAFQPFTLLPRGDKADSVLAYLLQSLSLNLTIGLVDMHRGLSLSR